MIEVTVVRSTAPPRWTAARRVDGRDEPFGEPRDTLGQALADAVLAAEREHLPLDAFTAAAQRAVQA